MSLSGSKSDVITSKNARKKPQGDLWLALRYLWPYRRIVALSTVCALFVGLAMAGGLGTLLPILRVLINGDTVPNWVNRTIVEDRLKVDFAAESNELIVVRVKTDGPGQRSGLRQWDTLATSSSDATKILTQLSDPAVDTSQLHVANGASREAIERNVILTNLPAVHWYWAAARRSMRNFPTGPVSSIAAVLCVVVVISTIGNSLRVVQEYSSDKAAFLAGNDIRRRLYDHILHMPMGFFGTRGTSDVSSRLLQDSYSLQNGFQAVLGQSIQLPINALLAFAVALKMSWKLTLFITLFTVLMVPVIRKFGKKMRRANRRALQGGAVLLGQIEGTMQGIRVVKGQNSERFERRRFSAIITSLLGEALRMSRIDAVTGPTFEVSTLLVVCVVVIWATNLMQVKHELKPEQFFVVMACLATIANALQRLGKLNNVLQKSGAAAGRIFETLSLPTERPRHMLGRDQRPMMKLPLISREIRFENVTFSYANTSNPALMNVSLTVNKGQSVAIVGRNGSGKTTLAALLPRFYDPLEGRVLIDGLDLRDVTLKSLREQITVVTQDSVIFPGTIAENIAYGHPMARHLGKDSPMIRDLREQIQAAAKRAFAHDFIMDKPQGYDTLLGELGGSLSGGQKQRINIARAIMRSTPILILDEATSQVDAESENLIQKAIDSLMHERTTFVIAHRLGTILSADRIVVMDRGQVVGEGTHNELLQSCETYANLYERQLVAPAARTPAAV